jgi:hypothetical protein
MPTAQCVDAVALSTFGYFGMMTAQCVHNVALATFGVWCVNRNWCLKLYSFWPLFSLESFTLKE